MSHSLRSDDDLTRAAFLCRTAATASSPIHPPRLYSRPVSPSSSMADESDPSLRSTSRRKTTSLRGEESCPLSRAKLERVLRNGRVVEGRSRSREPRRRDSDSSSAGWPWSDIHSGVRQRQAFSSPICLNSFLRRLPNARNPAQAAKARTVRKNTFTSTLHLLVILLSPDQGAKPILHYPSTIIEQQPIRLQCCRNRCLHQGLTPHQSGTTLQVQGRRLSLLP